MLEYIGSFLGISGAIMLALNTDYSGYGFILFLISAILLTIQAYKNNMRGLFTMQSIFIIINLIGIYQWL